MLYFFYPVPILPRQLRAPLYIITVHASGQTNFVEKRAYKQLQDHGLSCRFVLVIYQNGSLFLSCEVHCLIDFTLQEEMFYKFKCSFFQ